jgi:hypothetical protein
LGFPNVLKTWEDIPAQQPTPAILFDERPVTASGTPSSKDVFVYQQLRYRYKFLLQDTTPCLNSLFESVTQRCYRHITGGLAPVWYMGKTLPTQGTIVWSGTTSTISGDSGLPR